MNITYISPKDDIMLKENQLIKTRWNPFTKKYYESLGYEYTGKNAELWVKIEDLPLNSHVRVDVICDFCGKEYSKAYKDYNLQHNGGDCCVDCEGVKSLKTGRERYGNNYRGETLREISLERYGVDNVAKLNEIQEKIRVTNLERYGMSCALVDEKNHKKGIECSWSENSREKRKATNIEKYGHEWGLSCPDIREKINNSYYNNGTQKTSIPQIRLFELIKEIYGNCELNYPCGRCSLDCMVDVNGIKIDVEYDGKYWHQDGQRDRRRDEYVKSQGYKILRIIGNREIPAKEVLTSSIQKLIENNLAFTKIILD